MGWPLGSNYKYKCHCHCSGVTESTGTDARLLICSAGSQMSDVHHRHQTFSTTYLNSPCGRLPVPTGVPRKSIPLPREPRNLQSRSRLYRGIFLNFNTILREIPRDSRGTFLLPLPCKTLPQTSIMDHIFQLSRGKQVTRSAPQRPAHLFKHGRAFLGILHSNRLHLTLEHEEVLGFHQNANLLQRRRIFLHLHRLHSCHGNVHRHHHQHSSNNTSVYHALSLTIKLPSISDKSNKQS